MTTAIVSTTLTTHPFVEYVADRAASREVEALLDFYSLGTLIVTGELAYENARDLTAAAFKVRDLAVGTAKVYVSQGYCLAQLFDSFDDLEEFADEVCNGSRSLKRIYDATRVKDTVASEGEGEGEAPAAVETVPTALVDVVLAGLANLTDPADIRRVARAAADMMAAMVKAA